MGQTREGLPFPDGPEQVGDREFWKAWALTLDAKLREATARAEDAERLANEALDRVDELERKPAPKTPEPEPVDLTPLEDRINAMERKPEPEPVDLAPLERRLTALEGREMPVDNTERIDRLTAQLRQLQALHGLSDKQLDALDQED